MSAEKDALADWLGAMGEARNVFDVTDEATTVITIDVETLAERLNGLLRQQPCRNCGILTRPGEVGVNWPWVHDHGRYGCGNGTTKAEPASVEAVLMEHADVTSPPDAVCKHQIAVGEFCAACDLYDEPAHVAIPPAEPPLGTPKNPVDGTTHPCPTPGYGGAHVAVGAGAISSPYCCHGCSTWFVLPDVAISPGDKQDQ